MAIYDGPAPILFFGQKDSRRWQAEEQGFYIPTSAGAIPDVVPLKTGIYDYLLRIVSISQIPNGDLGFVRGEVAVFLGYLKGSVFFFCFFAILHRIHLSGPIMSPVTSRSPVTKELRNLTIPNPRRLWRAR